MRFIDLDASLVPAAEAQSMETIDWKFRLEVDRTNGTLAGWFTDDPTVGDPNTDPDPAVAAWGHDGIQFTETAPGEFAVAGTLIDPDGVRWDLVDGVGVDRYHVAEQLVFTDLVIPAGETFTALPGMEFHGRTEVMGDLVIGPGADVKLVCDESTYVGGDAGMGTDPGLHIMGPGRLLANGTPKKRWTRLLHDEAAGNTVLAVEDTTGWQPGDLLSVVPTVERSYGSWWDAYDYVTIDTVVGDTVTITDPLQHPHPERFVNGRRYTAEVINLTADARIWSDHGSRGHIMFHHGTGPQQISHVEFHHLGPRSVTGRYALHFHRTGSASAGSLIEGCIASGIENRSFVPHETEDVTFRECVAHDCVTTPFWWDSGPPLSGQFGDISERILYDRCVVTDDRAITWSSQFVENASSSGFDASVTNNSTMRDCVVVGLRGIDHDNAPRGGIIWAEGNNFGPSGWDFTGTLIHNCRNEAMGTWQNTNTEVDVTDVDAYSCSKLFDHGAYSNPYHYIRCDADDMDGPNNFHAQSGGAREQRFKDITETGRAAADWTIRTPSFRVGGTTVFIENYVTDGAGIHLQSRATHPNGQSVPPELFDITGFVTAGQRYLWEPDCHPDSLVTDHDEALELRPVTYTGDTSAMTWRADWNCWALPI